jgi:hypothetical protein
MTDQDFARQRNMKKGQITRLVNGLRIMGASSVLSGAEVARINTAMNELNSILMGWDARFESAKAMNQMRKKSAVPKRAGRKTK